ncbi:MAG TPA: 6-hydroxymethylpterin diphosphokinase MptE-like protein [Thermoplasmata archaeon]|nr:6-hydroxymethylpterin diphosphokinase MptE-like protein [Thermoplasmata archaeon]
MEYASWAPQYDRIREAFGFPLEREERSAARLRELLRPRGPMDGLGEAGRRIRSRVAVVVGLSPGSGAPPIWRLGDLERPVVLAADGAAQRCLAAGLVPDVVVTDLDGPVPSEVTANARGALTIVHAHGDNREALERWVPEFTHAVAGSWAGPPTLELLNVGGFTDGDRAVFLAEHVQAARILLWGFEFDRVEETEPEERQRKLAKLRFAGELIGWLASRSRVPIETWDRDGSRRPYPVAATGPSTQ